jgi:phospholipid N-methyltransferase
MLNMSQRWTDYRVFWRQFRESYHSTGAVLPSGRALASALSRYVREIEAVAANGDATAAARVSNAHGAAERAAAGRRILEVGPGTGAVTAHILPAMRDSDRLVLVERNEQFVARLRGRMADEAAFRTRAGQIELVHACVEDLPNDEPFDVIISGLPLNNFSAELVERLFEKLRSLLAPEGTLSFFEYMAIRRAKALVSRRAERQRLRGVAQVMGHAIRGNEVRRDRVLANVPPAWVHHVRFGTLGWGPKYHQ